MIKINFDKYGKIRNLDFGDEVIFKGSNRVNQIFVTFDGFSYNPNHYMTYSALINENDYEGNLTDLATAKTTIDGVEGYTFYLFSNLTAKAGELKLSVRLVDRTTERVLVSGIIPLVIEDTAISTYASVDITKTQYNALLTAFDELSQSIDATNFKTINGESIYGEGDIVVLTGDVMVDYVGYQISNVNNSLHDLYVYITELQDENAELNALIEKQDKKIKQLELASEGNILSTITESDSAYEVDVGVDTLPYTTIDKIGGMTYKSNNLLVFDDIAQTTTNGITYSVVNGEIKVSGTATSNGTFFIPINQYTMSGNHNVKLFKNGTFGTSNHYFTLRTNDNQTLTTINLVSQDSATYTSSTSVVLNRMAVSYVSGQTYNFTLKPMLINGSTAPTTYQPYFEGLRDSKVTEIISEGYSNNAKLKVNDTIRFIRFTDLNYASNNVQLLQAKGKETDGVYTIILNGGNKRIGVFKKYDFNYNDTYLLMTSTTSVYDLVETFGEELIITSLTNETAVNSVLVNAYKLIEKIAIPTAIQNLDGYGLGVDSTYYNYVDFENKKLVKQVAKLYLKNLSWSKSSVTTIDRFKAQLPSEYISINGVKTITNMEGITSSNGFDGTTQNIMAINAGTEILIQLGAYGTTTLADFTARLNQENPIVIIPLATPVAEGLSHIIDGEILTEVESGGTLTLENEYKQDVPFTWTFQEKL